jgi:hypothetical protein
MSEKYPLEDLMTDTDYIFQKDPEFEALLGKLSKEEERFLAESIAEKDKILTPLTLWVPPGVVFYCVQCGKKQGVVPESTYHFGQTPVVRCSECHSILEFEHYLVTHPCLKAGASCFIEKT